MLPTQLRGAFTHNLKDVDLTIEPGEVVAITGVSGSGKSSLALDTLYAEGQRRFVESFSPYARQFLERLQRPPMRSLEPVPAAIAVARAASVKSSRSTVATMADVEPLLAGLFVREGWPLCPIDGALGIERDTEGTARGLIARYSGQRAVLSYRVAVPNEASYLEIRESLARDGFRRLWFDAASHTIDELMPSQVQQRGHVDVVTDRVKLDSRSVGRLRQGLEQAWRRGDGVLSVAFPDNVAEVETVRTGWSCPECSKALSAPSPGQFSYETPIGACVPCRGFGRVIGVDLDKVIPDPCKTLAGRAIKPWGGKSTTRERNLLRKFCERGGIPMDVPWASLPEPARESVLRGEGQRGGERYPGIIGWFNWLETKIYKMHVRVLLSRYRSYDECPACRGCRLNDRALAYQVGGWNVAEWHRASVTDVVARLSAITTRTEQGRLIVQQLLDRCGYLESVGLGYLSLDRQARTLSGGEAQRVTLTAALGSSLHNALFVLDEPSVGLHPADIPPLTVAIQRLAERNNAVLLIEHDPLLIRGAHRVVELGPGAGPDGGVVVFDGSVEEALAAGGATARACALPSALVGEPRQLARRDVLSVHGANAHNLERVDVDFPLGCVCAVSGPSGSGKSTLVVQVLYRALARRLGDFSVERPGEFEQLVGGDSISRVVLVDQSPLGRTSRGNAATYTKAWDAIRKAFAEQPAARQRGYTASHFSFNVDGGRCEACSGEGSETVEMQFLADVRLQCPICRGQRFKPEILSVTHAGISVAQILEATVDEVLEIFRHIPAVVRALGPLPRLGLGYLQLGQSLSTLSGGEAQRLKLARALTEKLASTLYVVDEPSAGLHADEVRRVIECFRTIVEAGGSVITVEHDLEILRNADWLIDIGPGAGAQGGQVVGQGAPAALARLSTLTAKALRAVPSPAPSSPPRFLQRAVLEIHRAREHNLKDVSVEIPHNALTVVTGPSGSGKSSLVFDVLFAEGQRRFLETLTPYARQFLPTLPKPDVDLVVGVPPSVALEQRTTRAGSNSTVATVTEIAHYLRLLFAKLGVAHCPTHHTPIGSIGASALLDRLRRVRGKYQLLAPVVEARKGTYLDVFNAAVRDGIAQAICDGKSVETDAPPKLTKSSEHTIDLILRECASLGSLEQSALDRALTWGRGSVKLRNPSGETHRFSVTSSCPECGFSVPELDPRWFSFNTEQGKCPSCDGRGALEGSAKVSGRKRRGRKKSATKNTPRKKDAKPEPELTTAVRCPACDGQRLAPIPRSVLLAGQSYPELNGLSVEGFQQAVKRLRFEGDDRKIAEPILSELERRGAFLLEVGLGYLTLERSARSLSGGEMQRLRLAAQLGAGLTGALYVLDEPTIGLHPRDTAQLLGNLRRLVALGSTVVVVEHDADMIRAADHLVDMGPGGGTHGGCVMAVGLPRAVLADPNSPTARCLGNAPRLREPLPVRRSHPTLTLRGVRLHNMRGVDADFAIGRFNVVAGVSGSGKSSLVRGVLLPAVRERLGLVTLPPGPFEELGDLQGICRAVSVDQSPIGRTPRSVPATFLGLWDIVRALFARTSQAQISGFAASRFSFNAATGGRCEACAGQGVVTHEMSFLPDVVQPCSVCRGARFEPDTLEVTYLGLNIGQVLQLSVDEACEVFRNHPKLLAPLSTLRDLGAGYIKLGQGSHTLSGGESQRLKLAAELTAGARHEPTLYVLDEPTTGLHQGDVEKLVSVLERLIERGDTLVVIEHHPWVIAGADTLIELGPGGGEAGGKIIAKGRPSVVSRRATPTGQVLASLVGQSTRG